MNKLLYLYFLYILIFLITISQNRLYPILTQKIQKVQNENITYFGSCGWIAYLTSEVLDKEKKEYKIYSIYSQKIPNRHIFISYDNSIFDYHGFHPEYLNIYTFFPKREITKQELYEMIHKDIWNKKFNVKDTILLKKIFYEN